METLNTKKVLKNYVHPDIFLERWEADDMTPMSQKEKDAFYNTSQKCYPIAFNNWLYKVPIDNNAKDYNNYIVVEEDEEDDDEYTNIETLDDLADCCEIYGRTDAEEYIARAVELNGWEWKKDDWLCYEISDGKRTLKISVSGESEYDEEGYDDDENELDDYGTY